MSKSHNLKGEFHITRDGAIFRPDAGDLDEIFMSDHLTQDLIDGDSISVSFSAAEAYAESSMAAVTLLSRSREVIGVVLRTGHVEPLHEIGALEVRVRNKAGLAPVSGDVVLLKLCVPKDKEVIGDLVRILSDKTNTQLEEAIILREFGIPISWSEAVLKEAEQVSRQALAEYMEGREDLRDVDFVTIDGEGARDFDDAIFCEKVDEEWRISVAIADVSVYVKVGGNLDREAFERGNSVYLPGSVVPMLPTALSDYACSLRPEEDKLALVCRFMLSADGEIKNYEFTKAVIRSRARLYYTEVGKFLSGQSTLTKHPQAVAGILRQAQQAYQALLTARKRRKTLEFDTGESRILFDSDGTVRGVVPVIRNDAHRLIEEFMIAANVCAARFITAHGKALLFRVHTGLKKDSVSGLRNFVEFLGLSLNGTRVADLADLFEAAKQQLKQGAVQTMILRSLSRALYQPENFGHFGLALDEYGHFTSPIRRYPDLITHRVIHKLLGSREGEFYSERQLEKIGKHCSMTEKRADDAVYSFEKYLKCLYVCDHIGKVFTGTVTEVTHFGLFIELEGLSIEGLLHVTNLHRDYYIFEEAARRLVGKRTGQEYQLLDTVSVVVEASDPESRRIDLSLPGGEGRRKRRRRK